MNEIKNVRVIFKKNIDNMNFDMYNITTPVEFRTIYNPTTGSKSYRRFPNGKFSSNQRYCPRC